MHSVTRVIRASVTASSRAAPYRVTQRCFTTPSSTSSESRVFNRNLSSILLARNLATTWKRGLAECQRPSGSSLDDKPIEVDNGHEHKDEAATHQHRPQDREQVTEDRLRASRFQSISQAVPPPASDTSSTIAMPPPAEPTSASTPPPSEPSIPPMPSVETPRPTGTASQSALATNHALENETLPSNTASKRSAVVARFHHTMERLLERITIASQRVNTYTGTDYSGIESLRAAIRDLEDRVKTKLGQVTAAKERHSVALAAQSASQKEVVQLLERKHSWSAPDLERYMSLIRSEHVNEQAVQAAKDSVAETERELEEARARLEKYERRQYHEEQIWSDTIRRNSTWVTFGLMGFNILLLLFSLVAIEPWRRKRLVKEMKSALDERSIGAVGGTPAASAVPAASSSATVATEAISAIAPAASSSPSKAEPAPEPIQEETPIILETASGSTTSTATIPIPKESTEPVATSPSSGTSHKPAPPPPRTPPPSFVLWADTWALTFAGWRLYWADLFSERDIALRRVDLTAATLEGAAAGAACMGLLFVLLRPK